MVEELSRRMKELESKLGEHKKEKLRPKLSEEAVETLLSQEGVPKWMEKFAAALMRLFKDAEEPEEMNPVQFLRNVLASCRRDQIGENPVRHTGRMAQQGRCRGRGERQVPPVRRRKSVGLPGVMTNLPHINSGPWGHTATMQNWRTSGQTNPTGPCLENVIAGDVRVRSPKTRLKAYNSPE